VAATQKNAVVTGGASGIGRSICRQLARDGVDVAVLDLNGTGAEAVAAELAASGRRAVAHAVDVADGAAVRTAFAQVTASLGPVHILVNDAGIGEFVPLLQMSEAQWDRMIGVHLKGNFNCTQAALPSMIQAQWGRVVNITSVAGLNGGGPAFSHYAAAKAGIVGFTKALSHEFARLGITANAIAPGLIDTPILKGSGIPDATLQRAVQHIPVGRIGTPEDIAAACAYLVSEAASFITGQVISPNGGVYL
jgi:NAD(P)-dependent dehydrogenase (short-subunit alcohol dehydrogenase family)